MTLYLDKGAADQLRPGMMGTILEGPDGDKPFEGGSFSISQVLGGVEVDRQDHDAAEVARQEQADRRQPEVNEIE